jgi:hypothetical protein
LALKKEIFYFGRNGGLPVMGGLPKGGEEAIEAQDL